MRSLTSLLLREPAAIGAIVASIVPLALVFGLAPLDKEQTAATIVAINALVAFGLRRVVSPAPPAAVRIRRSAAERLAS